MSESSGKSVTVPHFNGREEDYSVFWPRFEAYADMKGFMEAADYEKMDPDLPQDPKNLSSDADTKKKQEAAIKETRQQ